MICSFNATTISRLCLFKFGNLYGKLQFVYALVIGYVYTSLAFYLLVETYLARVEIAVKMKNVFNNK